MAREWRTGDTITLALPKALRTERLRDDTRRAAVLWGPLVLAGDLGPQPQRSGDGDGDGADVVLSPFYRLHRRIYTAYWDLLTPAENTGRLKAIEAERARVRRLE